MTTTPDIWRLAAESRPCSVEGCDRVVKARGMCSKHYQRLCRGADVTAILPHEMTIEQRFWSNVDKGGPGGCWLWTGGSFNTDGYVRFALTHTITVMAHRYAYEQLIGPILDGLDLDHVRERGCRHRHCVNPAHLEPVTPAENVRRVPENPTMVNGRKTHCHLGHPLSGANLYVRPNGKRECIACRRARKLRDGQAARARL